MVIGKGFCDKSSCNNWPECNYQQDQRPPCAELAVKNFTASNSAMARQNQPLARHKMEDLDKEVDEYFAKKYPLETKKILCHQCGGVVDHSLQLKAEIAYFVNAVQQDSADNHLRYNVDNFINRTRQLSAVRDTASAREWTDEEKIQRGFNPDDFCGPCGEFKIAPTHPTNKTWIKTNERLPPEGVEVETKIDDGMKDSPRSVQKLVRKGRLWFYPDMSMYVYYIPTHWLHV